MTKNLDMVADIGGTNTRVALAQDGRLLVKSIQRFRNDEIASPTFAVKSYGRAHPDINIQRVCIAMAGPVRNGIGQLTNLDWKIDEDTLAASCNAITARIINDLQAQGHAIGQLRDEVLTPILKGPKIQGEPQLVINLGTGFNAAPVYQTASGTLVPATEAGHIDLPVLSEEDFSLQTYLEAECEFASVEEALSGRGLEQLYAWRAEQSGSPRKSKATEIVQNAETDPIATEAITCFIRLLGAVSGNLALTHLPYGGIFLVGGLARGLSTHFKSPVFAEAFAAKGRFRDFMQDFSVELVEDDYAALSGCARCLMFTS